MTNEKVFTLIERLLENTKCGKIGWEATANSNKFVTSSSNYSIIISEEGEDYFLTIMDEWDDLVERINDVELSDTNRNSLTLMSSLFMLARRGARGTDKAIDDILSGLG